MGYAGPMDWLAVEDRLWSTQAHNIHAEQFPRERPLQVAVQLVTARQDLTKQCAKRQESWPQHRAPVVPPILDRWWSKGS